MPKGFKELLIQYWMEDEKCTRDQVLEAYGNCPKFEALCEQEGKVLEFKPDLGYRDKNIEGTLCFEVIENNTCIPVSILT